MSYEELGREELEEVTRELEKRVEELESERDEYEEMAKKTKADFENYKKKQDERKEKWQKEARRELTEDLISVIDNLERALMAAEEDSSVVKGVEMVADQLLDTLKKQGLERIDAEGQRFDPEHHQAVETREHEEKDIVLEQKRPGYKHGEKVLRPAEVVVPEKNPDQKDTTDDN